MNTLEKFKQQMSEADKSKCIVIGAFAMYLAVKYNDYLEEIFDNSSAIGMKKVFIKQDITNLVTDLIKLPLKKKSSRQ